MVFIISGKRPKKKTSLLLLFATLISLGFGKEIKFLFTVLSNYVLHFAGSFIPAKLGDGAKETHDLFCFLIAFLIAKLLL